MTLLCTPVRSDGSAWLYREPLVLCNKNADYTSKVFSTTGRTVGVQGRRAGGRRGRGGEGGARTERTTEHRAAVRPNHLVTTGRDGGGEGREQRRPRGSWSQRDRELGERSEWRATTCPQSTAEPGRRYGFSIRGDAVAWYPCPSGATAPPAWAAGPARTTVSRSVSRRRPPRARHTRASRRRRENPAH